VVGKDSLALQTGDIAQKYAKMRRNGLGFRARKRTKWAKFCKRFIDVSVASMVLVLGLPFFLAISLLIKLTSRGPVFFTQNRIGEEGEEFTFFKFRTMRSGVDDSIHREFTRKFIKGDIYNSNLDSPRASIYKLKEDPRITCVGRFLRGTSLDELPQFINIIKGEMSIVGPRPPLKYEYKHYDEWHKLRLKTKPGITGLWQVSGRSSVPFHEMVMLDLYYIENWSLILDVKIMIRTIPVMLSGTGAY
jgi:lipopolysaccharide/colanic/teichoic acid biosynthesis glycosyltransferase